MKSNQQQKIWRSMSNAGHNGYFVWEVYEVVGEPMASILKSTDVYVPTLNGGYITIDCYHFFTEDSALKVYNSPCWDKEQRIIFSS